MAPCLCENQLWLPSCSDSRVRRFLDDSDGRFLGGTIPAGTYRIVLKGMQMAYVMVDIESDGPIPGDYSMICFGAVIVEPELKWTFYGRLKPISDKSPFKLIAQSTDGMLIPFSKILVAISPLMRLSCNAVRALSLSDFELFFLVPYIHSA